MKEAGCTCFTEVGMYLARTIMRIQIASLRKEMGLQGHPFNLTPICAV